MVVYHSLQLKTDKNNFVFRKKFSVWFLFIFKKEKEEEIILWPEQEYAYFGEWLYVYAYVSTLIKF